MKTYACFRTGRDEVYVECGEGALAVPRRGERIAIDGQPFEVSSIRWDLHSKPSAPELEKILDYPQLCATITVKRIKRARR